MHLPNGQRYVGRQRVTWKKKKQKQKERNTNDDTDVALKDLQLRSFRQSVCAWPALNRETSTPTVCLNICMNIDRRIFHPHEAFVSYCSDTWYSVVHARRTFVLSPCPDNK